MTTSTPETCPQEASRKAAAKARNALDDIDDAIDRILAATEQLNTKPERTSDRRS